MPRNGTGGYSLPSNSWNPAVNGAAATASDWQALINDVATALQQSVSSDGQTPMTGPLNMGGSTVQALGAPTGTGQSLRWEQLTRGSDIASAATIGIPVEGTYFVVTGTTTINTISDTFPGRSALIKFAAACTLTNSSGLVLPQNANITTSANDIALFINDSPGVWICAFYRRAGSNSMPIFTQSTAPTVNVGYIMVDGIGLCSFDVTDNKYYRVPLWNNAQEFTASGTFTPDAFTKYVRLRGCAGGGAGGRGSGAGSGGGAGEQVWDKQYTVVPSVGIPVTIGAGGVGNGGNGSDSVFGTYQTLKAGSGGLFSGTLGTTVIGGNGGTGGTGTIPGGRGFYGSNNYFGAGADSLFGQGGQFTDTTTNDNSGRGYGSGGAGSSAGNTCNGAPGYIRVLF